MSDQNYSSSVLFDRFELKTRLASGDLGTSYSVWDPAKHVDCFLVVSDPGDDEFLSRFTKSHPRLQKVLETGFYGGSHFVILEKTKTRSIIDYLNSIESSLKQREITSLLWHLLDLVEDFRTTGRQLNDVVFSNLHIGGDGRVFLSGFEWNMNREDLNNSRLFPSCSLTSQDVLVVCEVAFRLLGGIDPDSFRLLITTGQANCKKYWRQWFNTLRLCKSRSDLVPIQEAKNQLIRIRGRTKRFAKLAIPGVLGVLILLLFSMFQFPASHSASTPQGGLVTIPPSEVDRNTKLATQNNVALPESSSESINSRQPPPAVIKPMALKVLSIPEGADIYVNETKHATVTPTEVLCESGKFVTIAIKKVGYQAFNETIRIEEGTNQRIFAELKEITMPKHGFPWQSGSGNSTIRLEYIHRGSFTMGSPKNEPGHYLNEGPTHTVTFSKGYWIGRTEVTRMQWFSVMESERMDIARPDSPMTRLSYHEIIGFCKRITEEDQKIGRLPAGFSYTLPTEAQWEYACRAGSKGPINSNRLMTNEAQIGMVMEKVAWTKSSGKGNLPQPVALKAPNPWGLYDMHGNVWEVCRDNLAEYTNETRTDPVVVNRQGTALRGGSINENPLLCRAARRGKLSYNKSDTVGFRIVLIEE